MRKLFLELKEQGKTMVIASHSAEDIDILCDTVHEMDKGVLYPAAQLRYKFDALSACCGVFDYNIERIVETCLSYKILLL